jgi:hypothetical protein
LASPQQHEQLQQQRQLGLLRQAHGLRQLLLLLTAVR